MPLDKFNLSKVKASGEGVEITFSKKAVNPVDGNLGGNLDNDALPHPDLLELLKGLKPYLLKSLRIQQLHDTAVKYLKGDQKKKFLEDWKEIEDTLEITGVSWSGKDDLEGVIISGKYSNQLEGKTPLNSPRIVFSSEILGYEQKVQKHVERIRIEAHKYFFEGKKAQGELFDEKNMEKVA